MKRASLFLRLAATIALLTGCVVESHDYCDSLVCPTGVTVALHGLVASDPSAFPLTIETCLDQTCSTSTVSSDLNGSLDCTRDPNVFGQECTVVPPSDFQITLLLPEGATQSISLTVKDSTGATLFTGQQAPTTLDVQADPTCGVCGFQLNADFTAK